MLSRGTTRPWLVGLWLALFALPAMADTTYIVQHGDTLTSIARDFGISVATLANRNALSKNHLVQTGQRLVIPPPVKTASASVSSPPAIGLPRTVTNMLNAAPVRPGRWKYIVIHHSGVDEGTVRGMDRYHREARHMENGLAYHFVIGNGNGMQDGEIAAGHRWKQQLDGGHLRSEAQNRVSLGICLVGNFDKDAPTAKQMQNLNALVRALMKRCNIPTSGVKTHQQINVIGTRCPGKKFPTKSFLTGLKTSR